MRKPPQAAQLQSKEELERELQLEINQQQLIPPNEADAAVVVQLVKNLRLQRLENTLHLLRQHRRNQQQLQVSQILANRQNAIRKAAIVLQEHRKHKVALVPSLKQLLLHPKK